MRTIRLLLSALLILVPISAVPLGPLVAAGATAAPAGGSPAQTSIIQAASTPLAQAGAVFNINIINFDYDARKMTVPVGTTLTWTNTGDRPHTATDRGGTFDTQPIAPNAQASVTLTVPGTYFYFCRINPSKMNGIVEVQPTPADAKVVRIQAVDDANIQGETLRFDPPNLTVRAGTTLLAANAGGKPHTVTADDGSFTTGIIAPGPESGRFAGTNATVQLTKPGTFSFHCEIHPQAMKGTITVTAEPTATPPTVAGTPAAPSTASVAMEDFRFRQPQVAVHTGGQVTFTNNGQANHTATFDDVPGTDTGAVAPGKSATLKVPDKPGNYSYRCTIHPASMRAVIVVLGDNTPDPIRNVSTTTAAASSPPGSATGQAAPADTRAPPVTKAAGASGPVSTWVLVTAIIASLLAGAGITEFLRRRA